MIRLVSWISNIENPLVSCLKLFRGERKMDDLNKKSLSIQYTEQYAIKVKSNSPSQRAIKIFTESILDVSTLV